MDTIDLLIKLKNRELSLLESQKQESNELLGEGKNYARNPALQKEYFFNYSNANEQLIRIHKNDIEKLEEKNGRLIQKFLQMKIHRRNNNKNNLDR
jgi:hypothetical protein